jgi:hypothetical protein
MLAYDFLNEKLIKDRQLSVVSCQLFSLRKLNAARVNTQLTQVRTTDN